MVVLLLLFVLVLMVFLALSRPDGLFRGGLSPLTHQVALSGLVERDSRLLPDRGQIGMIYRLENALSGQVVQGEGSNLLLTRAPESVLSFFTRTIYPVSVCRRCEDRLNLGSTRFFYLAI